MVQSVLVGIQSVLTPLVVTLLAYNVFRPAGSGLTASGPTPSVAAPTVAVFGLAFLISRSFACVYEHVVQSLLVCVTHDIERYGGRYLRPSLREAFDLHEGSEHDKAREGPLLVGV